MYLYKFGLLPADSFHMFLVTCHEHSYETRSLRFFHLPYCRTNIRNFSTCFQGPKFFISLSFEIQNATSIATFTESIPLFITFHFRRICLLFLA